MWLRLWVGLDQRISLMRGDKTWGLSLTWWWDAANVFFYYIFCMKTRLVKRLTSNDMITNKDTQRTTHLIRVIRDMTWSKYLPSRVRRTGTGNCWYGEFFIFWWYRKKIGTGKKYWNRYQKNWYRKNVGSSLGFFVPVSIIHNLKAFPLCIYTFQIL